MATTTNREQLLREIAALSDDALAALMDMGYGELHPEQPEFGLIVCQDCAARQGREYQYDCDAEDPDCNRMAAWMRWPCRRERIL